MKAAVERLKKRGFQIHVATVEDAGETKLFVRRDKLHVWECEVKRLNILSRRIERFLC